MEPFILFKILFQKMKLKYAAKSAMKKTEFQKTEQLHFSTKKSLQSGMFFGLVICLYCCIINAKIPAV